MTEFRAVRLGPIVGAFGARRKGPHRRHWFIRRDDFLVLDVTTENLKVVPGKDKANAQLFRAGPGTAYLIVTFPPQHLVEEAYFTTVDEYPLTPKFPPGVPQDTQPVDDDAELEKQLAKDGGEIPDDPPIPAYLADWSTLGFIVRDEHLPIDWTLEGILCAIPKLELNVAPNALPNREPPPGWLPFYEAPAQDLGAASLALLAGAGGGSGTGAAGTFAEAGSGLVRAGRLSAVGASRTLTRARTISHTLGLSNASGPDTIGLIHLDTSSATRILDVLKRPAPRAPTTRETALELPYRLVLSPNQHGTWFHSEHAVRSDVSGHTELWHTRLGVRLPDGRLVDGPDPLRTVRAIWTKDYDPPLSTPLPGVSVDTADPSNDDPFRASLDASDRHDIVHLSSNFQLRRPSNQNAYFEPQAMDVDLLALSALGGWLDSRGVWNEQPLGLEVEEWRHRATLGRDHYVRVVYAGRLFPLGHRASLVKVTERRFDKERTGHPAYLRQMMFLVPREQVRTYGASGLTYKGPKTERLGEQWDLQFPFTAARILDRVSPLLDMPEATEIKTGYNRQAFWPFVGEQPFGFHILATDLDGNPVDFHMPLVFIGQAESDREYDKSIVPTSVVQSYNERTWPNTSQLLATVPLGGQKVAFAKSADPDDTASAVESLTFGGEVPIESDYNWIDPRLTPRYVPVVRESKLANTALQLIAQTDQPASMVYASAYLKNGFDAPNYGEVFLAANGTGLTIPFRSRSDRSGGLVAPEMTLGGLSRITGPVGGDIETAAKGTLNPKAWFGAITKARLFGAVPLTDILDESDFTALDELPRFVGDSLNEVQRIVADLERLRQLLAADALPATKDVRDHLAQLTKPETGTFAGLLTGTVKPKPFYDALEALSLELGALDADLDAGLHAGPRAVIEEAIASFIDAAGSIKDLGALTKVSEGDMLQESLAARFDWRPVIKASDVFKPHGTRNLILSVAATGDQLTVTCSIDSFDLDFEYLVLTFKRVQFRVRAGKKPEIDVELDDFVFAGPLSFIETLRDLVPLDGFADPPDVDVTPEGITAGFSTALPNIAVGAFSLENLSLAAGFSVPFVDAPMTTWFRFCERENPARLTVSLFGGGFFFGITVDAEGLQVVEGAIEFGAAVSMDFGVASGSVSAMAGLYFKIEGDAVTLAGYFRLRGEVEALGVVSVCIELYLEMRYEDGGGASNKVVGTATIKVEVEVALWSTTIKITATKKFAGSGGDPTLAETLHITANVESEDWNDYVGAFAA